MKAIAARCSRTLSYPVLSSLSEHCPYLHGGSPWSPLLCFVPKAKVGTSTSRSHELADTHRLKCDRVQPCSNCVSRSFECTYATNPRARQRESQDAYQHMNARIRHLEQLVNSVVSNTSPTQGSDAGSHARRSASQAYDDVESSSAGLRRHNEPSEVKPGRLMSNKDQTIYVSGVHWASICDEVWFS